MAHRKLKQHDFQELKRFNGEPVWYCEKCGLLLEKYKGHPAPPRISAKVNVLNQDTSWPDKSPIRKLRSCDLEMVERIHES